MPYGIPPPRVTHSGRGSRRIWTLILFGVFHLGYAASTLAVSSSDIDPGDAILFELFPVPVRAAMWTVTGLVAVLCAPSRRWQKLGWVAAMVMPMEHTVGHVWSAVMYYLPGYPPGLIIAPAEMAVWAAISGLVWVTAGWPEPDSVTIPAVRS